MPLIRRFQVAAKKEVAEGTAEVLTAADAAILARDAKLELDVPMLDRVLAESTFSRRPRRRGLKSAVYTFGAEMRGSGTATTAPFWFTLMEACGFQQSTLESIAIGAIAGGPYQHGETITGGTSNATGRVMFDTANGAAQIYFVSLSGTFQSGEVLTGATSSATSTSSGVPVNAGLELRPDSAGGPALTMGAYEDGLIKRIRGCRGTVKATLKNGELGTLDFEFRGVLEDIVDGALLSGITHETTTPPLVEQAALKLGTYSPIAVTVDFDMKNTLAARGSMNAAGGIVSYRITNRDPTGSVDPELVPVATEDFYGKFLNETEVQLDVTLGSTAGNRLRIVAPKTQYTKPSSADRDGIAVIGMDVAFNRLSDAGDDELSIVHY